MIEKGVLCMPRNFSVRLSSLLDSILFLVLLVRMYEKGRLDGLYDRVHQVRKNINMKIVLSTLSDFAERCFLGF